MIAITKVRTAMRKAKAGWMNQQAQSEAERSFTHTRGGEERPKGLMIALTKVRTAMRKAYAGWDESAGSE